MTIEDRIVRAFEYADHIEPTDDLWDRVVHSIEEDRRHRRRVVSTTALVAAVVAGLVGVGALASRDGALGRYVPPEVMVALETVALAMLVVLLGPAIRRFGRGYAADLWPVGAPAPAALLRLLDLAYFLVFGGYILLTTDLELIGDLPSYLELERRLPDQLAFASARVGGLLLTMGVLHAVTLAVLPLVAFVHNSTRQGRELPRWMRAVAMIAGVLLAMQVTAAILGLVVAGLSG